MNKKIKQQFTETFLDEFVYGVCDNIGLDMCVWENKIRKAAKEALNFAFEDFKVLPRIPDRD